MYAGRTIAISRKGVSELRCPHCGTTYQVIWQTPAQDNGSAECDACGNEMMRWTNSPIPSFRRKGRD